MVNISLSEFADRLNELMPKVMREFMKRQTSELCKWKVTLPQLFILNLLDKEGESRMTDIAHFLNVSTAAATGIVDRLVRYGYVQRVFQPQDRRIIKIKLSSKGAGLAKKMNEQKRQMIIEIFGKISQEERGDYLRILMRIYQILKKESKG